MPSFHDSVECRAVPEEVWKLLYDPARFPEWWAGIGTVEVEREGAYTMYPDGYPDFPMAQLLDTHREEQRVTVSCMVSDLRFEWRLEPAAGGTRITVGDEQWIDHRRRSWSQTCIQRCPTPYASSSPIRPV